MATKTIITKVGLETTHQATNEAQKIAQTNTITQMEPAGNQYQRQQQTQRELAYTTSLDRMKAAALHTYQITH